MKPGALETLIPDRVPRRADLVGTRWERLATRWSPARVRGGRRLVDASAVSSFCLFVGHPRSGITLVGQLLNAHPEILVCHELDVLRYVDAGLRRDELFELIVRRNDDFVEGGTTWAGYDYEVPGWPQTGRRGIRVIGDKHGAAATTRLTIDPGLLDRLAATVDLPVRMIHVVRDPRDAIPTMMRKGNRTFDNAFDYYFAGCPTLDRLHREAADGLTVVHFESFVDDPVDQLRDLVEFLGLDAPAGYLDACAGIVFDVPRTTRDTVEWPPGGRRRVEDSMAGYDWLAGYL